ncbi:alpha-rhamnosidase [Pediococcus siamensis]|uniref:alpha-L-rhamnosidase-related protein n=1 Tax=Pediococcus siamensis TaxID=381829 RepID=UPI0039A3B26F
MAFTFQINPDVQFNHESDLLEKAEANRPKLHKTLVKPTKVMINREDTTETSYKAIQVTQTVKELGESSFGKDDQITLDFGNHYVGHFAVSIQSVGSPMDAPLFLRIRFAEVLDELTRSAEAYNGWLSKSWMQEEFIHLDKLPARLELPRRYSCRYVEIKVIDTSRKWRVQFSDPTFVAQSSAEMAHLPATQIKDAQLNKIYQISVRTLHECMQEVFEDGPKRDRRLWLGDLHLAALSDYATFDQVTIVKRCLYLFGGLTSQDGRVPATVFTNGDPIPDDTFLFDYSIFFVSTLFDYYQHTKDKVMLHDLYRIAKQQIDLGLQYVDQEGCLKLPSKWPVFVDWSDEFDKTTCAQAILIYGLRQFIQLAEAVGEQDILSYQKQLHLLVHFSTQQLFDSKLGLFTSGAQKEVNLASQVWMVLAGVLARPASKALMVQAVKSLFPIRGIVTPYMYHFIVAALFKADHLDTATGLLKTYWGKMVTLGADTFWEAFDPNDLNYSPYGNALLDSYCHAWSCTPAFLITKYCL